MHQNSTRMGSFAFHERDALYAGIRRGIADGQSDQQIARVLGIASKTVHRYRRRHKLPNFYGVLPPNPDMR